MIEKRTIEKSFEDKNREKIILMFLEDDSKEIYEFNEISSYLINKNMSKRADHHLKRLVKDGMLEKTERGSYTLNAIARQPLRNYYKKTVPICLIGGLGIPTLFNDVLAAFEEISILPRKYVLFTSPDYHEEFRKLDKSKYEEVETVVREFDYQKVLRENYQQIYEELEKIFKEEIKNYEIVCEITGGTKPVSIALLNLSTEYNLRRCYFSGRKIIWI